MNTLVRPEAAEDAGVVAAGAGRGPLGALASRRGHVDSVCLSLCSSRRASMSLQGPVRIDEIELWSVR